MYKTWRLFNSVFFLFTLFWIPIFFFLLQLFRVFANAFIFAIKRETINIFIPGTIPFSYFSLVKRKITTSTLIVLLLQKVAARGHFPMPGRWKFLFLCSAIRSFVSPSWYFSTYNYRLDRLHRRYFRHEPVLLSYQPIVRSTIRDGK